MATPGCGIALGLSVLLSLIGVGRTVAARRVVHRPETLAHGNLLLRISRCRIVGVTANAFTEDRDRCPAPG